MIGWTPPDFLGTTKIQLKNPGPAPSGTGPFFPGGRLTVPGASEGSVLRARPVMLVSSVVPAGEVIPVSSAISLRQDLDSSQSLRDS